ncbi:AraC family transcriptional regulator [Neobacillus sp. MER 74]|uniref:AraC family transcriptional regulator n=1 Tax=Neobacillus sp. MER 74 TaxID=2939566 RepID=UPI00203A4AF7|nr:AraC family transcriptional regulator [Neobacillus sp. MER 74]MCM3115023.1 AraC family transcriptional regulator [Neobacillus sp. MER 74]
MYVEHLQLQRSFAFCRVWGSDEEHDLHIHDCLEIGVVLKNELKYQFNDHTYIGRPGDVFLCRPFEPHWSFSKPDQPFECILVLFTPSSVHKIPDGNQLIKPFYTTKGVQPLIPANTNFAKTISKAATLAVEAQEQGKEAWVTHQFMHLIDILLQVNQYVKESQSTDVNKLPPSGIVEAVGYMLDHYHLPLDIEKLSSQVGLGRTMFFKEFRQLTGLTPNEFLNRLRIQSASDLLRTTNKSMIDLAFASGFQSLSAFNKQFKRYTGQAPREYRKKSNT